MLDCVWVTTVLTIHIHTNIRTFITLTHRTIVQTITFAVLNAMRDSLVWCCVCVCSLFLHSIAFTFVVCWCCIHKCIRRVASTYVYKAVLTCCIPNKSLDRSFEVSVWIWLGAAKRFGFLSFRYIRLICSLPLGLISLNTHTHTRKCSRTVY